MSPIFHITTTRPMPVILNYRFDRSREITSTSITPSENLFPPHEHAASQADRACGNDRHVGQLDGPRNPVDSLGPDIRRRRVDQSAPDAGEGVGDLAGRNVGEDLGESTLPVVHEEGSGHSRPEDDAHHLADRHEADAVRDLAGGNLHLRDREACLAEAADARAQDDSESVDLCV